MSTLLETLVSTYVDRSPKFVDVDEGESFAAKKTLEKQVVVEIVKEQVELIDQQTKEREHKRAAERELDEFRSVLFQCVTLALLVGLLGSHIYGLLEAFLYQPADHFNVVASLVATAVLLALCVIALVKNYLGRLYELVKRVIRDREETHV